VPPLTEVVEMVREGGVRTRSFWVGGIIWALLSLLAVLYGLAIGMCDLNLTMLSVQFCAKISLHKTNAGIRQTDSPT